MHKMAETMHEEVTNFHAEMYKKLKKLEEATRRCSDMKEQADMAFAMRECIKLLDDTVKGARKIKETAEKIGCALWVKDGDGSSIKTPYCTATPKIRMIASLPSKRHNPEQYLKMMEHLGINPELCKEDTDVVRPHWPGLMDHITALAEQGKPLPPGISLSDTYPQYSFTPLRKGDKGIGE